MQKLAILSLLLGLTTALPRKSTYVVKDTFQVPRQWTRVGEPGFGHSLRLSIGLKQGNFAELERHLYEVSDPDHSRYGQHLTVTEVEELIKPSGESSDLVHDWLSDCGIDHELISYSPAGDFLTFTIPLEAAEELLNTKYSVYRHNQGDELIRTTEWSLPRHLHEHVDSIQPTNSFLRNAPNARTFHPVQPQTESIQISDLPNLSSSSGGSVAQVCNTSAVTPECLRTYYGTINYMPKATNKNSIGLTDYLGETNNRSDVGIFLSKYRPDATQYAQQFPIIVIAGGDNQQTPDTPTQLAAGKDLEGNLDAETIIGITYPTKLTAYTTGGSPPFQPDDNTPTDTNEPYMTWVNYVLAQSNVPQVISTSYDDDEQTVPLSYAISVCNQFAQLGARGVSLLFASGDSGVGPNGACFSNDGKNKPEFIPNFPSTCPYITSVGATKNFSPEVAAYDSANGFASGGGFSNYFTRPKYQDLAVAAYFAQIGNEYSGLYNRSGRGYPDISAQGQRFITIWDGQGILLDGTSASTPTAASILSLVNDGLIAAGRSPLGFLNPWLYSRGFLAFHDITNGSSIGCDTNGFQAVPGWDAVTGYGTPFFNQILALALATGS